VKNVAKKVAIDSSRFVNIDTGEFLVDAFGGDVASVNVRTEMVKIEYPEFFSMNVKAYDYLRTKFNDGELGRITAMCGMIKRTEYNVLFSRRTNKPHTKETLLKELEIHKNTFEPFLKKLVDNSVLYLMTGVVKRRKVVYYILNPTIACKQQIFPKKRTELFEDFTKKELPSSASRIDKFEQNKIGE
jgi:hypothetical protein